MLGVVRVDSLVVIMVFLVQLYVLLVFCCLEDMVWNFCGIVFCILLFFMFFFLFDILIIVYCRYVEVQDWFRFVLDQEGLFLVGLVGSVVDEVFFVVVVWSVRLLNKLRFFDFYVFLKGFCGLQVVDGLGLLLERC